MELDFVDWLRERLTPPPAPGLGVGDDAAVVDLRGAPLVATSDLLIDGVHFDSSRHAPERIGRKALAVNLSDLAAMAAEPVAALVSLALPHDTPDRAALARRLTEGMLPLCEEFACPIVGGDTNTGPGPLTLSVTALGKPTARGVVRRDGARPGDLLYVTGDLGGSLRGKHLDFTPRVSEALALHQRAEIHAMMDLSDGLPIDLARLCRASGVGALIDPQWLPLSDAANALYGQETEVDDNAQIEAMALRAIADGEDFELLIAAPPEEGQKLLNHAPRCGLSPIGEVVAGEGVSYTRWDGQVLPLPERGYEHR